MAIGILYESEEWSSYALEKNIQALGIPVSLINTEEDFNLDRLLDYRLIVNRVCASAQFRDHRKSLDKMPGIIRFLQDNRIPMINPYDAHFCEIDKYFSTETLRRNGLPAPEVYGVIGPSKRDAEPVFPCVMKPRCGGRTNYTYILHNEEEYRKALQEIPDIEMILEEYIEPVFGYLTRIEVIDNECRLILKRSVVGSGLSSYHSGSIYTQYPECNGRIKETAVKAMNLFQIGTGSLDIIENKTGFYIIDVNSVSNASEDNTEMFQFDLMLETAKYIVKEYTSFLRE